MIVLFCNKFDAYCDKDAIAFAKQLVKKQPKEDCPNGCNVKRFFDDDLKDKSNIAKNDTKPVYIFLSFSVPQASWLELSQSAKKHNCIFVLRGLPKNSFMVLRDLVKNFDVPIEINPELFTKYDIKSVPTFVCDDKKVEGNVSFETALTYLTGQKS